MKRAYLFSVVVAMAVPLLAASANAQKPKTGGAKPKASASASAAPTPTPEPAPPPPPPEPTPSASASASAAPAEKAPPPAVAEPKEDPHDPTELTNHKYYYIGLRYRGTIIPSFLMNIGTNGGGQTLYWNGIGAEFDYRTDGFSRVISVMYQDFNTPSMLFLQGDSGTIGNYSMVNSSLKAVFASVDLLWSMNINKTLDFEYGVGIGIGATFGDLVVNWVKIDPAGQLTDSTGRHFSPCTSADKTAGIEGCTPGTHKDSDANPKNPIRVDNFKEPGSFNGGNLPPVLPYLSIPQVGLRIHPVKEFEGRVSLGFSPYGFYFQLGGAYGLPASAPAKKETPNEPPPPPKEK
jgi:hypothetical protein